MPLTPEQQQHINNLIAGFGIHAKSKYEAGAKEHGGNLWDKGIMFLVEQAIMENIDQFIYLMTLRDELVKIQPLLPKPKAVDIDKA